MNRFLPIVLCLATLLITCGGRLSQQQPSGYADLNGDFRTPDGKLLYEHGAKCAGYDIRKYGPGKPTRCKHSSAHTDPVCDALAQSRVPLGYPVDAQCYENRDPTVTFVDVCNGGAVDGRDIHCTNDANSAAFCQSFWRQFVLGDAHVETSCKDDVLCKTPYQGLGHAPPDFKCQDEIHQIYCYAPACLTAADSTWGTAFGMFVTRNGQKRCEQPCAPPPN